jgi:hypothetical protein
MKTLFRHAAVVLAAVTGAGAADAQTVITREEVRPVLNAPLKLSPSQRATIYRTIVPQGRGRAPIVRERIVIEPVNPPVVRERIVRTPAPAYSGTIYEDYAYAPPPPAPVPRERIVRTPAPVYNEYAYAGDYALAVGSEVPQAAPLAAFPSSLVARVPVLRPYRYMIINGRLLLIDPATSTVVAEVTE